jgi:uncharacterized protein YbjT (DUF2867 family)
MRWNHALPAHLVGKDLSMSTILVTGATGTLGTPTVALLRAAGHDVRALSRGSGPGLVTGNLISGHGIRAAVTGADTVVHLATGLHDIDVAKTILDASREAGIRHFVFMSIVGIEQIPLGYYKKKLAVEGLLAESGLPYTILRATQFHKLLDMLFRGQRFSPAIFVPKLTFQSIAVEEVAARLAELAGADAAGRVADIGGPERRTAGDLARVWKRATGTRRPIVPITLPGRTFAGYAAGHNLVPGTPYGTGTFEHYLAARYGLGERSEAAR